MPVNELANAIYAAYQVEVSLRGNKLILDDDTKQHIQTAAEWLSDPHGKFGLMLQGLYGNGKTTLMMAICNLIGYLYDSACSNERMSVKVIEAKEIARLGSRDETRESYVQLFNEELLAIDELGEEPAEIINYGMVYTPVKDLLLERYRRQKFTIVSTNLVNTKENPQLKNHYGERVVDRIREMMKIIVFKNDSYRKTIKK
ncbi:MAG: replication protein [Bacteroides sp.]|nr:replication protein [Bacteroides sp.]